MKRGWNYNKKHGSNDWSTFVNLPQIDLIAILDYLEPKEKIKVIFLCKNFASLLEIENYTSKIMKDAIGLNYKNDGESEFYNYDFLNEVILLKSYKKHQNLPFYGFESNGGIEGDLDEFWISLAFTKGCWSHCTKTGSNFMIKGAITKSYEYLEPDLEMYIEMLNWIYKVRFQTSEVYFHMLTELTKMIPRKEKLLEIYDNFVSEKYSCFRRFLKRFFRRQFEDRFCIIVRKISRQRKLPAYVIIEKFSNVAKLIDKNELNLNKEDEYIIKESIHPNYNKAALITSFEFSRKGMFTCPIKTFVVFASLQECNMDSPIFNLFDDLDNHLKFVEMMKDNKFLLPNIKESNIPELKPISQISSRKCHFSSFKYGVFSNFPNKLDPAIKPIMWGQFNNDVDEVNFKMYLGNFFTARFIYVKLINCEDKMMELGDLREETNIDFNFFLMKGILLDKFHKPKSHKKNSFNISDEDLYLSTDEFNSE